MNRAEAIARLQGAGDVSYDDLDAIFHAFGFESRTPSFEVEVYYHPTYSRCGLFTARDPGFGILSQQQRALILGMLGCVEFHEEARRWQSP